MKKKRECGRRIKHTWAMQVEGLKWLYVFQVIYAITSILLFRPLCNFVIRKLLRLYGYSYITSENMLLFFGKLPVIGALLLLLLLFALFSFLALMYIYRYISDVCHRKNVNCFSNVLSTYKDVKRLLLERQYSAVFLVIGTGLLYAMPIIFFAMKNIPSVHYVVKSFLKIKELKRMLYIGMVLFLGVMLRHTYTLSSFFEGESSFKKAKETSKKIFLRRPIRTVVGILFWNLVSVGFCGICYTIIIGITILLILLFVSNNLHVAVFCTVQEKLYFMGFSLSLLFSITLQITGNLQFFDWVKEKSEKYEESEKVEKAARIIMDMGVKNVLVKGGHLTGDAVDYLCTPEGVHKLACKRVDSPNTHGTGCTLSSAITANLAHGMDMLSAVTKAKNYITEAIEKSFTVGKGHSPVNHFYDYYDLKGTIL